MIFKKLIIQLMICISKKPFLQLLPDVQFQLTRNLIVSFGLVILGGHGIPLAWPQLLENVDAIYQNWPLRPGLASCFQVNTFP